MPTENGNTEEIILYKRDAKEKIRVWSIWGDDYEMCWEHGVLGGELQDDDEYIGEGKAGRSQHEQLLLRINSKIKNRLDRGYVYDLEKAKTAPVRNQLGLKKSMLAGKFNPEKHSIEGRIIQPKLNGYRCMIHNNGKELIAYTRKGIKIKAIHEIISNVQEFLPCGATLDGELYHHGTSLQKIGSWAKKRQEETKLLYYIVYDQMSDMFYGDRIDEILEWMQGDQDSFPYIANIQHFELTEELNSLEKLRDHAIDRLGYEGLMIRDPECSYEDDRRSNSLLKYKRLWDAEFVVMNIVLSDKGQCVLQLVMDNGKSFSATCPGKQKFKDQVYKNRKQWIGATVNIEYPELTDEGVVFQPVATEFVDRQFE